MTPLQAPTADKILQCRDMAIQQMRFTRDYLLSLIDDISDEEWLWRPPKVETNVAWQIGHLAVAEYGLMLFRQRGRAEGDLTIMPGWLRKNYGKGTTPVLGGESVPSKSTMLSLLAQIHERALLEASELQAATLAEPIDMPYAVYPMKIGALMFAPIHESIHIGQLGLLRRLMGKSPIR